MNELPKCSNASIRKARKEHKCYGCLKTIKVGEKYQYTSGVWDVPMDFKHCLNCANIIDNYHLMDKNLLPEDGPHLDWWGVADFLRGFLCTSWQGRGAADDMSRIFGVPIDYALEILGVESCQP